MLFLLDHTTFLPSYSPWDCHIDLIFPVPPLASVRLYVRNLATELICTMAKLVSHVIRTLGKDSRKRSCRFLSEFSSAGKCS